MGTEVKFAAKCLTAAILMLLLIRTNASFADEDTQKLRVFDAAQMGKVRIEQPSVLFLYSMARKYEMENKPEIAADYYKSALEVMTHAEAGYVYIFGKEIADHYILLLKAANKLDEVKAIENEFCQNKCSNPWNLAKVKWHRFDFPLPAHSGKCKLDVRMIHPVVAEYGYRFTGTYLNEKFIATPGIQTGGPANLEISWIENGGRALILFCHDDKNFQGKKYELFDLKSKKMLDATALADTAMIKGRLQLAYLDQFLKYPFGKPHPCAPL